MADFFLFTFADELASSDEELKKLLERRMNIIAEMRVNPNFLFFQGIAFDEFWLTLSNATFFYSIRSPIR